VLILTRFRTVFVAALVTEGESALGGGINPFYERNLIPGWLEIEAAVAAVWVEEETVVAFEVLLKKPFHVNEVVNPYAGLGPEVALLITPEGTRSTRSHLRRASRRDSDLFRRGQTRQDLSARWDCR